MKDVSSGFGTESLRTTLLKPGSGYTCSIEYKVFGCSEAINHRRKTTNTASANKYLFLTYQGQMRVLLNKGRGYRRNLDYKVFACSEVINDYRKATNTASANKYLSLTYQGLLRVL